MVIAVSVVSSEQTELAHPRDMVTIKEGTPYVVPTGKIFVLTGLGRTNVPSTSCALVSLSVGASVILRAGIVTATPASVQAQTYLYRGVTTVATVPPGITVAAAGSITVSDLLASSTARAYGYLSDD